LNRGRYSRQLQTVFNTIPAPQILILNQEALQTEHEQSLLRVFRFLDIHRHAIPPQTVFAAPPSKLTLNERLARAYARLYFWLMGESPKAWQQVQHKLSTPTV
ncbi:hypothetical protein, partial [Bowmanella dokdonensis]